MERRWDRNRNGEPVEPLHGLTFALLHLACMAVIARTVPSRFAATAQAIYGTWVMAVLCAAALPLAWDCSSVWSARIRVPK
jgi:MFS_1 like family